MRSTHGLVVVTLALCVGTSAVVWAQAGPAGLQGAWNIDSVTTPKPANPPRNKPSGLIVISGTHVAIVATDQGTRPPLPEGGATKATADQLRATWGPVVAQAGTFTVNGNTIRLTNTFAKGVITPGNFGEWTFTLNGDSLMMTQVRNQVGPYANPVTLRLTRAK